MKILLLIFSAFFISIAVFAQDSSRVTHWDVGVKGKRYIGFYLENGVCAEFSSQKIWNHKIQFGASVVTSTLGSAFFTNAIPATELEFSIIKHFRRNKSFQPLLRLNTGFAHANFKSGIFKDLQQNSFLLSGEFGLSYRFPFAGEKLCLKSGLGYNVFTGNGVSGLGTVFPAYFQFSLLYRLK